MNKAQSIGSSQMVILKAAFENGSFECTTNQLYRSSLKLHDRGFLDRDPRKSNLFYINDAGACYMRDCYEA